MPDTSPHYSNPYTDTAGTTTDLASTDRPASERVTEAREYRKGKKTGKELMKMQVISLSDGSIVGQVLDVIYNPNQGRLIAVTIPVGGSFLGGGKTLLLRTEDMHSLGEDAIIVKDPNAAREVDRSAKDFGDEAGEAVLGKRLMTDDGSFLGSIVDVLIDRESRRITAYEVGGGLWHDLMKGQTDVPVEHISSIGADVVIVPASVKNTIHEVSGGLVGTAQIAGEKLTDAKDAAATKIEEARTVVAEKIEDKEIDYAIGKVAGSDVTTDAGHCIVRTGDPITESHVQQALAAGKMHQLAMAAGKAHAADLYDTAREKASAGVDTLREKAGDAQEAFKDKQGDLLIGKTAGRDVTFADNTTLVTTGTVITEEHVMAARAAGKLGDLTTAVGADALAHAKESAAAKYDETKESLAQRKAESDARHAEDQARQAALHPTAGGTVINAETVIVQPSGTSTGTTDISTTDPSSSTRVL